jgi:polysaccharide biosynthesis protein PslG
MMNSITLKTRIIVLVLAFFALVGCIPQTTVQIRVTPTPQDDGTAIVVLPTNTETLAATTDLIIPTDTEEPATPTETIILPSRTAIQTDGSFGPIVESNYTPPPTTTPRPIVTASPVPPTAIPETPITTRMSNLPFLDRDQMGIQLYYNVDNDAWWQLLRRVDPLDVGWIKVQANWEFLQPNPNSGFDSNNTAFSIFESHVQRAHNEGWRVLVSIAKAPDWARAGVTQDDGPPANTQDLVNFVNLMLSRMSEQIDAIEIWNEPNLSREWTGGLNWSGAGYMELFRPSYDAIRAINPNIAVVTAGLAPTNASGAIDDRLFLQQMYDAGLADPHYQNIAIGIHPYGWGNPPDSRCCDNIAGRGWDDDSRFFFLNTIEDYRQIMVGNGHAPLQMWATEFGWASWEGIPTEAPEDWMLYNTPHQQAEYTMRAFQIGQSLDYIGPMFLWNLNFANDDLIEERNEMAAYSLFIPNVAPRPLYEQLANRPR